jgi:hypothetical protein
VPVDCAAVATRGSGCGPAARTRRRGYRATAWLLAGSLSLTAASAACDRPGSISAAAGTVTLVNRVRAQVSGVTCATCAADLEAALRKSLDAFTMTIDPGRRVELAFERTATAFPSASFRQAVADRGGEVQAVEIEVCGSVNTTGDRSWLTSGSARLLIEGPGPFVTGVDICLTGELRDQASPPRLVLGKFGTRHGER